MESTSGTPEEEVAVPPTDPQGVSRGARQGCAGRGRSRSELASAGTNEAEEPWRAPRTRWDKAAPQASVEGGGGRRAGLRGRQGTPLVLDGGLATRLEAYGRDLGGGLWSARLLAEEPEVIRRVHRDYFEAGADVAIAAGYQASVPAFTARGYGRAEAERLVVRSVELALAERDAFGSGLVAAGVGPYGAALADGSEYTGDYDLDEDGLYRWHRDRWRLLVGAGADLVACETLPSLAEARALARLLRETPGARAWVSFSCRDGEHISDGTPMREAVAELAPLHTEGRLVAVGVNCTSPRFVPSLVRTVTAAGVPAVAYPNSGEVWDAAGQCWRGTSEPEEFGAAARVWRDAGAALVGGCCRTGPEHIRSVRAHLSPAAP